jgi:hypothetical protein
VRGAVTAGGGGASKKRARSIGNPPAGSHLKGMTRSLAPVSRSSRSLPRSLRGVLALALPFAFAFMSAPSARADESPQIVLSADVQDAALERRVATVSPLGPAAAETGVLGVAQWERVCVAPCGLRVDPRYAYRVSGDGLVPTAAFSVPRSVARVDVDAKLGSSPWRVGGAVASGVGVLGILAGGAALGVSPVLASEDVGSQGFRTAVVAGGAGALALGALTLGAGLYAFFTNASAVHVGPRAVASTR